MAESNLHAKAVDVHVYGERCKGIYGLSQSGILVNELLEEKLVPFGYR